MLKVEITAIAIILLAIFLALSLFAVEITGEVGRIGSLILLSLFGMAGSLAVVTSTLIAAFFVFSKRDDQKRRVHAFLALFSIAVVLAGELSIPYIRREFPYRGGESGGGLLGSFLGRVLVTLLGEIGAWVLIVAVIFLGMLWVTGTSFSALLQKISMGWKLIIGKRGKGNKVSTVKSGHSATMSSTENDLFAVDASPVAEKQQVEVSDAPASKVEKFSDISKAEQLHLPIPDYLLPELVLLNRALRSSVTRGSKEEKENVRILEETLANFGVIAKVVEVTRGPTCARYEMQLSPGTKVSKVTGLSNDLAMSLASDGVRIEAPIPGKAAIGIEVPNKSRGSVFLRDVIESSEFAGSASPLTVALGKDVEGSTVVADLVQMPHLLIAGATGAGKSVCINAIICSVLFKARPDEVKLMLIDPKVVELSQYNGIPHLVAPVLNHPKKAAAALKWAVSEMEKRYALFARSGVRDIARFNERAIEKGIERMPYLLLVIDELADLMMVARADVEDAICRLAQMARAAGMHLVIGTQRPSTDVITGLIKANIPSRLSFTVSSATDSRVILDMSGAEKLLGQGDMLFLPVGQSKARRVQGAFVSNREIEKIVDHVSSQSEAQYAPGLANLEDVDTSVPTNEDGQDDRFEDAVRVVAETGQASVSMLQRRMRLGYTRAARIVDQMEANGIVGPSDGSRPRQINKAHPLVKAILEGAKK